MSPNRIICREQDKNEANLNKMALVSLSGTKSNPTGFSTERHSL